MFSFDRVVIEPLPWPGDMTKTIDDTNLGNYFFEVREPGQWPLLYSRGSAPSSASGRKLRRRRRSSALSPSHCAFPHLPRQ